MDDTRFTRLEQRVDEIKDDVSELKSESKFTKEALQNLRVDIKDFTQQVKEHVAGDDKIVNQLIPILGVLPEVIEQFNFEKAKKVERNERIKYYASRIGLVSLVVGLVLTVAKTFGFL